MCQKKDSPPSSPLPCCRQIFGEGSSTSGSLHLSFSGVRLKLGFMHLFFSYASLKLGSLRTFSSTVQAPSWVLRLPELWACKSIEEEKGLEAVANLSSAPPPRLYLIPLYLPFQLCSELWRKLIPAFHCTLYYFFVLVKREIYLLVLNTILFATLLCERVCSMCVSLQWYLERETRGNNWIFCDKCENTAR